MAQCSKQKCNGLKQRNIPAIEIITVAVEIPIVELVCDAQFLSLLFIPFDAFVVKLHVNRVKKPQTLWFS